MTEEKLVKQVWPLGKPDTSYEIPLWDKIRSMWIRDELRPVDVSLLVSEALEHEGYVKELVDVALREYAVDEALDELGWVTCESIKDRLQLGASDEFLMQILDAAMLSGEVDCRYAWESHGKLCRWRDVDGCSRYKEDMQLVATSEHDSDTSMTLGELLQESREPLIDWIIEEWLLPHGFVNLDKMDWSSKTDPEELLKTLGQISDLELPDVLHWYAVSRESSTLLKNAGCIVVEYDDLVLWGRTTSGQRVMDDGKIKEVILKSDYLNYLPPLGALRFEEYLGKVYTDPENLVQIVTHAKYPFKTGEMHPAERLVEEEYLEAGWTVEWGPEDHYSGAQRGHGDHCQRFRLVPPPEVVIRPYLVTVDVLVNGEFINTTERLVLSVNREKAKRTVIENMFKQVECSFVWISKYSAKDDQGIREYRATKTKKVSYADLPNLEKYVKFIDSIE